MPFFSVKMVNITHDSHRLLPLQRYLPTCVIFEVTFNNMLMTCYSMLISFCKGEIFCTYSVSREWIGLISYILVDSRWNIVLNCSFWGYLLYKWHKWGYQIYFFLSGVCVYIYIYIERERDLERVLLPLFLGQMIGITLNSNQVLQIHRKRPLCAKSEVAFLSLV